MTLRKNTPHRRVNRGKLRVACLGARRSRAEIKRKNRRNRRRSRGQEYEMRRAGRKTGVLENAREAATGRDGSAEEGRNERTWEEWAAAKTRAQGWKLRNETWAVRSGRAAACRTMIATEQCTGSAQDMGSEGKTRAGWLQTRMTRGWTRREEAEGR